MQTIEKYLMYFLKISHKARTIEIFDFNKIQLFIRMASKGPIT